MRVFHFQFLFSTFNLYVMIKSRKKFPTLPPARLNPAAEFPVLEVTAEKSIP
jgi:hypothetical protein